jgi:uncharacterized protein
VRVRIQFLSTNASTSWMLFVVLRCLVCSSRIWSGSPQTSCSRTRVSRSCLRHHWIGLSNLWWCFSSTTSSIHCSRFCSGWASPCSCPAPSSAVTTWWPFYARRVSILAVIGLLHIGLVWYGDILLVYAIGGFGLLAVRHWNTRLLVTLALALALFARATVEVSPPVASAPDGAQADAKIENAEKERKLAIFGGTSYGAIARENATIYYRDMVGRGVGLFLLPQVFARFILGLYVGRRDWARRTTELRPTLRRLLPWAIGVGVVGNGTGMLIEPLQDRNLLGGDSFWVQAAAPVEEAGILALAFVYLSVLVLVFHHSAAWRRRLGYLAPVGRMALTNYLTQSVLYLILFTGVGFGLYGDVGPAWCVGLALIIFAAQMASSAWWLARYRFGPAEWVWRTLTYGQLQPLREPVSARTA